jgi:hypothetical protein
MVEHDENLLPEPAGTDGAAEWAAMPEGKPEEFGLPPNATLLQKAVWHRQEMFLESYRRRGKINKAATAVGLTRWAVIHWQRGDVFSFNRRLEAAHKDYCENVIEQDIDDTLADKKFNHDILRIFRAKAEWPEKYREDVKPRQNDAAQELLDRLTAMAAREIEERKRLEEGATEGEYRDLGEKEQRTKFGEATKEERDEEGTYFGWSRGWYRRGIRGGTTVLPWTGPTHERLTLAEKNQRLWERITPEPAGRTEATDADQRIQALERKIAQLEKQGMSQDSATSPGPVSYSDQELYERRAEGPNRPECEVVRQRAARNVPTWMELNFISAFGCLTPVEEQILKLDKQLDVRMQRLEKQSLYPTLDRP